MEITGIRNPSVAAGIAETAMQPVGKEQRELIHAVRAVNGAALFGADTELTFYFDRDTHKALVRIINKETREVVRQIPAEAVLRIAENLARGSR